MNEKKRFNVIDVLIIASIALIVLAVVFRGQIINFFSDQENLTEYTVEFISEPTPNGVAASLVQGVRLNWVEMGCELGRLEALETTAANVYSTDPEDGSLKVSLSPTDSVIKGSIPVRAQKNNGCYVSGTYFLASGMQLTLRSTMAQITVTVTNVAEK